MWESLGNTEAAKVVWNSLLVKKTATIHELAGEAISAILIQAFKKLCNDSLSGLLIVLDNFEQTGFGEECVQLPSM